MKKTSIIAPLFLIAGLLTGSGCATSIKIVNDRNRQPTACDTTIKVNRWVYGLVNGRVNAGCPNGLKAVQITTTAPEVIFSLLTLGIYCPVTVSWSNESKDVMH